MKGISIITPVFNRLDLLKETVDSVLNQTSLDWEWILVDDGSESEVIDYLKFLSEKDSRINFFHRAKENKGAPVCRNVGASNAKYDYLWFLDSDDLIGMDSIESRLRIIEKNSNYDFWIFPVGLFKEKPHDLLKFQNVKDERNDLDRFCFGENVWQTLGVIWKKNYFRSIHGFNESLPSFQDWELSMRSLMHSEKYYYSDLKIPDAFYRITEGESISNKRYNEKNAIANSEMILDVFNKLSKSDKVTENRRISLLNFYISRVKYWEFIETKLDRRSLMNTFITKAFNIGLIKTKTELEFINRYFFFKPSFFKRLFSAKKNHRMEMEESSGTKYYFLRKNISKSEPYKLNLD